MFFAIAVPSPAQGNPEEDPGSSPPTVGSRFGVVSSHIKLYPQLLVDQEFTTLENIGLSWLRCDFAWHDLEPVEGGWDFSGTDLVVQEAVDGGISILGILGTSPSWANGGNEWNYPPTDMEAWRNYVRTVAIRCGEQVEAWEIWNEENIPAFWQPEPDPDAYLQILAAASEEIRAVDPDAVIVMGGMAGLGSDFMGECLSLGAGEYVDAVAYHPYAETIGVEGQPEEDLLRPKESLCRWLVQFVHWLVSQNTQKDLQVWITEVGWTTCEETPPGVDADTQAAYLLRTMINYAGTDVNRVFWYNLRDTQLNDIDHYGLVATDFDPKPSCHFFSTFQDVFGGTVPWPSAPILYKVSDPDTLEAHAFRDSDGDLVLAFWKSDDANDLLELRVSDATYRDPLLIDPLTGMAQTLPGVVREETGEIVCQEIPVGKVPVIISLGKVSVSSISPREAYQHTFLLKLDPVTGTGFQPGARVRLEMGGRVIEGFNVQVASGERLSCAVSLWGVDPGDYDVVVINPDGSRARLSAGLKVLPLCGTGGGTALLTLGGMVGVLASTGALRRRKRGS